MAVERMLAKLRGPRSRQIKRGVIGQLLRSEPIAYGKRAQLARDIKATRQRRTPGGMQYTFRGKHYEHMDLVPGVRCNC